MVGENSVVTFDTTPGGKGLIETLENGGGLLWASVHMYLPDQFTIYLSGHMAADWGGPSTSSLKFALEDLDSGCIFKVSDAQFGNVDEKNIESLSSGWTNLFTNGLKAYVEQGTRQDQ